MHSYNKHEIKKILETTLKINLIWIFEKGKDTYNN